MLIQRDCKQIPRASGAELPSPAQGFVTAMQGPLFGFLDEMTGAVQGIKSAATGGEFSRQPIARPGRFAAWRNSIAMTIRFVRLLRL